MFSAFEGHGNTYELILCMPLIQAKLKIYYILYYKYNYIFTYRPSIFEPPTVHESIRHFCYPWDPVASSSRNRR